MTQVLNEIFQQILNSEQVAEQRKQRVHEMKGLIENLNREIKRKKEERIYLEKEAEQKIKTLNVTTTDVNLSRKKLEILQNQKGKLCVQEEGYLLSYADLCEELSCIETEFYGEVEEFKKCYGRQNDYMAEYRCIIQDKLADLEKIKQCLQQEIQSLEDKNQCLKQLRAEEKTLNHNLQEMVHKNEDLQAVLEEEIEKERLSEKEKDNLSSVPKYDLEFVRLQEKLSSANEDDLEKECRLLQMKLQALQQKTWQQTAKYRFQHRKPWHQQIPGPFTDDPVPMDVPTTNRVCVSNFKSSSLSTQSPFVAKASASVEEDFANIAAIFDDNLDDMEIFEDGNKLPTLHTVRGRKKRNGRRHFTRGNP